MPDLAYGWMIDYTKKQEIAEAVANLNARSIRHANMTKVERKQDDFDNAFNAIKRSREELEAFERAKYAGHYIKELS